MKASLKFLDSTDERTRVEARVKVPISILGLPLSTAINTVTGDTKSFRFDLSTAFESFPTLRFSYCPNDFINPFSLVVKSGIGAFGSPIGAPMSMSAEFTLPRRGRGPAFFLHFRPRIGDFSITKTTASVPSSSPSTVSSASPIGIVEENREAGGGESYYKVKGFPPVKSVGEIQSGFEFLAKSVLPVKNAAEVKFQWGVKIPSRFNPGSLFNDDDGVVDLVKQRASVISGMDFPVLVMRKISMKRTPWKNEEEEEGKKEVEVLRLEYGELRMTVEEIHAEFDRWRKSGDGRKMSMVAEEEELKKKKKQKQKE